VEEGGMSDVQEHLHLQVVRTLPASAESPRASSGDVGLTVMIFLVAAVPLVSELAGIGRWDHLSLGLGTLGVLFAGRELCTWLLAIRRRGRRP
jgi:hypothetical protein